MEIYAVIIGGVVLPFIVWLGRKAGLPTKVALAVVTTAVVVVYAALNHFFPALVNQVVLGSLATLGLANKLYLYLYEYILRTPTQPTPIEGLPPTEDQEHVLSSDSEV